jgi:cytochrome c biogenesis protein CcmG, thiol:disulfide interchange protein DsbE
VKRFTVPLLAAVLAVALIALLGYGVLAKGDDSSLDEAVANGSRPPAPALELPLLGAQGTRSPADYRGKVVVLNFWANWCVPCTDEAPVLKRAQERLEQEDAGTVLGVTYREASPNSLKFVREHDITYPSVRDVDAELAEAYGTHKLPETFVIDREGRIAGIARGQVDDATMTRMLDRALGS